MRAAEPLDLPAPVGDVEPAPRSAPAPLTAGAPRAAGSTPLSRTGGPRRRVHAPTSHRSPRPRASARTARSSSRCQGGEAAGDYVCSGTALNSSNQSVVWTAGHCVFDTEGGGFVTNWIFVPAYKDGAAPFGEWPAMRLGVARGLARERQHHVRLRRRRGRQERRRRSAQERRRRPRHRLQPAARAATTARSATRPCSRRSSSRAEREFRCTRPLGGTDEPPGSGPATMAIGCDMTGGSSGGGWVAGRHAALGHSYGYCDITDALPEAALRPLPERRRQAALQDARRLGRPTAATRRSRSSAPAAPTSSQGTSGKGVIKGFGGKDDDLRQGRQGHRLRRRRRGQDQGRRRQGQARRRRRRRRAATAATARTSANGGAERKRHRQGLHEGQQTLSRSVRPPGGSRSSLAALR